MQVRVEDAVRTLRERAAGARVRRERRAEALRARVQEIVREGLPAGARAYLIGSLAWGGFGERSDVDLVVAGLSGGEVAHLERALATAVGVEVDLLRLEDIPASFRARVESEGVRLDAA